MHIHRCIREDDIYDILRACHDEPCGGHFLDRRMGHKVLQMGYYWPTIFKDAKNMSKPTIVAKEWVALANLTKFHYNHS